MVFKIKPNSHESYRWDLSEVLNGRGFWQRFFKERAIGLSLESEFGTDFHIMDEYNYALLEDGKEYKCMIFSCPPGHKIYKEGNLPFGEIFWIVAINNTDKESLTRIDIFA